MMEFGMFWSIELYSTFCRITQGGALATSNFQNSAVEFVRSVEFQVVINYRLKSEIMLVCGKHANICIFDGCHKQEMYSLLFKMFDL